MDKKKFTAIRMAQGYPYSMFAFYYHVNGDKFSFSQSINNADITHYDPIMQSITLCGPAARTVTEKINHLTNVPIY